MKQLAVNVQSVSKQFGLHNAVNDLSFKTKEGEIFGVLGPNGAGKSTLIKMMMNILKPDSGRILFNGKNICEEDKNRIGYLPEERGLYRNVKIREMLLFFARLKNGNSEKIKRNLDEWLLRFGLMECKNRTAETLSKGMSQKVQFIAAILHDPDFIFFDEPFSGLDPLSTDMITDAILDLSATGKTVILSTHNMEIAEKICSNILIIDHGSSLLSGTLAGIKTRFGQRTIAVEFDGNLNSNAIAHMVRTISVFPRWTEIEMREGVDPQDILKKIITQVSIRKFEVVAPSLHKIYVDLVGEAENA